MLAFNRQAASISGIPAPCRVQQTISRSARLLSARPASSSGSSGGPSDDDCRVHKQGYMQQDDDMKRLLCSSSESHTDFKYSLDKFKWQIMQAIEAEADAVEAAKFNSAADDSHTATGGTPCAMHSEPCGTLGSIWGADCRVPASPLAIREMVAVHELLAATLARAYRLAMQTLMGWSSLSLVEGPMEQCGTNSHQATSLDEARAVLEESWLLEPHHN